MTMYSLTQAIRRYRTWVLVALGILVLGVLAMTFTFQDGSPKFRSGLTYESSIQIAVVTPGTTSLASPDAASDDLQGLANLFASLLASDEAASWIGDQNGYTLKEAVDAEVDNDSPTITARVFAPSIEQARAAALSTFAWLNKKLLDPITTADLPTPTTTIPVVILDGPFSSFVNLSAGSLDVEAADGLFLAVEIGNSAAFTIPLEPSPTEVQQEATLEPVMTVALQLSDASDVVLDRIRIAPDLLPRTADTTPELSIILGDDSVQATSFENEDGEVETGWRINGSDVTVSWSEGEPLPEVEDAAASTVDLALLTPEPGYLESGGRRGPIVAIAALIVGVLLILTAVIVADTWRSERDRVERVDSFAGQVTGKPRTNGEVKAVPVGVEVGTDPPDSSEPSPDSGDETIEVRTSWKQ